MKKLLAVLFLTAVSLSNCTTDKTYPTTYVYDTVKVHTTLIPVQIVYSTSVNLVVYADSQFVLTAIDWYPSDTFYVPDSSRLTAYIQGQRGKDTIATKNLVWIIN
jgi:hypothetical protein